MFLLWKYIEIGKSLISSVPQEFQWSPKGKFTCRNTVTSSRTLVKSHKGIQKCLPEAILEKSCSEKFTKNSPKRNYCEDFSSVTSQAATSWEKNLVTVIFQGLLARFFRILFCVRTLVKEQKKLKYLPKYVLGQRWFEEFHKMFLVKWQPGTLLKKDSITVFLLYHRGNESVFKIHS